MSPRDSIMAALGLTGLIILLSKGHIATLQAWVVAKTQGTR